MYYCDLCDYHINSITHARAHIAIAEHIDGINNQQLLEELHSLPIPSQQHCNAVTKHLLQIIGAHSRTDETFNTCVQVVQLLEKQLNAKCGDDIGKEKHL